MPAPTLSLCMMACKPAPRVRAILERFRPIVDEIVLAADSRGDPSILEQCADLADRRFTHEPAELERRVGWLHAQCSAEWIFRFDDDEAPSAALLAVLRPLVEDGAPMQVAFTRRWLYKTPARWILSAPWTPDYQIRLLRNAPGAWRYPGRLHEPIEVAGELRLVDAPIYHCDLLLAGVEERRAKRARYQAIRSDLRNGDVDVNGYYTPEDWHELGTASTPVEDLALIEAVRRGSVRPPRAKPLGPILAGSTWEAERYLETREVSPRAYRADIVVVRPPARLRSETVREVELTVVNLGDEWWPPGESPPLFRVGYRWRTPDGAQVSEGRALFSETVRPGMTTRLLAGVKAPMRPGHYVLEFDVVHELVRWFGSGTELAVEVTAAARTTEIN
jgi:hypothetical protein